MNFFDILIIAFLAIFGYFGFKKGLFKTVFETIGLIVAFFISRAFYYIIENILLEKTKLLSILQDFFADKGKWILDLFAKGKTSMIEAVSESISMPEVFRSLFIQSAETQATTTVKIDGIVNTIASTTVGLISFLITFLIVYLLLLILVSILNSVFKLPVLNIVNKGGGVLIGLLEAVIILYIAFAIASPIIAINQESNLVKTIQSSKSGEIFYEKNILLNFIANMKEKN